MSTATTVAAVPVVDARPVRLLPAPPRSRRERRAHERALARQDRISARLAELAEIRGLLARAVVRVEAGWVQHAWRSYVGPGGEVRLSHLPRASVGPHDAVCLVTGVRVSGAESSTQVVARSLDLVWHALVGDRAGVGLVAPPAVRGARVHDLTRWNDRRGRRCDDVVGLLHAADALAGREMARLRTS